MEREHTFESKSQKFVKDKIDNTKKPFAIVITARNDPNGVYRKHKGYFRHNRNQLILHGFEVIEIDDVADPNLIESMLKDIPKDRINFFWLRAHGAPKSIEFSKDHKLSNENLAKIFSWLPEKLDSNATIFLESCQTASLLEKDFYNNMLFSFGRLTQSMLDVSIVAPLMDSYLDKFSIDEHNKFHFVSRGPYLTTERVSNILKILDKETKIFLSNAEMEEFSSELIEKFKKSLKNTTGLFAHSACLKYLDAVNIVHVQALHLAIANNDFDATKELLTEFQADPNEIIEDATESVNFFPLNKAIKHKNINIIKLLLEQGANIFQEHQGVTPLRYLLEQAYNSSDIFYIESMEIFEQYLQDTDRYQRFIQEREAYRVQRSYLKEPRVLLQYSHKQQTHRTVDDSSTLTSTLKPKNLD